MNKCFFLGKVLSNFEFEEFSKTCRIIFYLNIEEKRNITINIVPDPNLKDKENILKDINTLNETTPTSPISPNLS